MDLKDRLDPVLSIARETAAEVDAEGKFPSESVEALRQSGLLGITMPVDVGGLGGGPHDFAHALSAVAGACGSTAMIYLMHVSGAMTAAAAPPARAMRSSLVVSTRSAACRNAACNSKSAR